MKISKSILFFLILIFFTESCVDRINFDIGEPTSTLVIEGQISDQPGPYTIKVSKAFDIESKFSAKIPVTVKELAISDDAGNREELVEVSKGIYQTKVNGIRGVVARAYNSILNF